MEQDLSKVQIAILDKNAVVDIKIGTAMVTHLQELQTYLRQSVSDEEFETYVKEFEDIDKIAKGEKVFSHPWMKHYTSLFAFLNNVTAEAQKQGHIRMANLEEVVKTVIVTEGVDLPDDQAHKQPE